jgi:hypothetical protein
MHCLPEALARCIGMTARFICERCMALNMGQPEKKRGFRKIKIVNIYDANRS